MRMIHSCDGTQASVRLRLCAKGWCVRRLVCGLSLMVALSGCSVGASGGSPTSTPAPTATITATTASTPTAHATPTVPPIGKPYAAFLSSICHAFTQGDAGAIINSLPYYQYNNGLRYGTLGGGAGTSTDPSTMKGWLSHAGVRCTYFTPDIAGHGTVLTKGWRIMGGWSLIELDMFSGHWKINDLTFSTGNALYRAMQTAGPTLLYHR